MTEDTRHTEIQNKLLQLGNALDLQVWIAQTDRNKDFDGRKFSDLSIKELPQHLAFDERAKRILRNIDVIWFKDNKLEGAFEIEATTSIYSGLLRLSDLLVILPNISFPIYIVAPRDREKKGEQQLLRPTFKYLKLNERCKYIVSEDLFQKYENIVFSGDPRSLERIATVAKEKPRIPEPPEHVPEKEEIWNTFYFEPEEVSNMTKEDFFKMHRIKAFQAYAYIRNSSGEITGIVFQGYKSRIDRHLKEGRYRWGTRKAINANNLKMDMRVFVVETDYDLDTRERVIKPRLRMAGRLKEVFAEKNGKNVRKIFPPDS